MRNSLALTAAMLSAGMSTPFLIHTHDEGRPDIKPAPVPETVRVAQHKPHQGKREAARRLRQMQRKEKML